MKFFTKKKIVLFLLFIFPLICFLWLSTGRNNFTKLPVLTEDVKDIATLTEAKDISFKNNVTVLCFLGNDLDTKQTQILNLNEKIYKKFYDYNQFQAIAIYPENSASKVNDLQKRLEEFTDMSKWNFISATDSEINILFNSFSSDINLENLQTSYAFIIDKDGNLRGRLNDEDTKGKLYGYNMSSIAELKDKMKDDVSVLYYEYYAAFREKNENKADRKEVGL